MTVLDVQVHEKTFPGGRDAALQDLHFQAQAGEFIAIVGPSGAGKSTLLNIVSGLDPHVDGDIRLADRSIDDHGTYPVRLGFIFQEPRLMPWLTVLDNLRLVLEDDPDGDARARRLLEEVELYEVENAFPDQLSGGMQRRVAMARAFARRPTLLLMDEPFLSLDVPTAARLRELLSQLWFELAPTVLFVTHNLKEALALADRVLFLSGGPGRIVLDMPVAIPRPRRLEDAAVGELHDRLLRQHPELLSGLTGFQPESVPAEAGGQTHRSA